MIKVRFNLFKTRQKGLDIWFVKYSAPMFCGFKLFDNVDALYHWLKFQGVNWVYDENIPLTDVIDIISKMTVFYTALDTYEILGY